MKKEFKDLITSIDVLNTLHGGVAEPFLSIRENEEGREIRVRVPGVSRESLQAEIINNNELAIHYAIPIVSEDKLMQVPKVVFHEVLSKAVDVLNIKATYNDDEIVVMLPDSKLPDGNHRKLKIDN